MAIGRQSVRAPWLSQPWDAVKAPFRELYVEQELSLEEVSKRLLELNGFNATVDQYKKKIKEWGFQRRVTAKEKKHMIKIEDERRKGDPPKETAFRVRDREVKPTILERFRHDHRRSLENLDVRSPVPSWISFWTRLSRISTISRQSTIPKGSYTEGIETGDGNQYFNWDLYYQDGDNGSHEPLVDADIEAAPDLWTAYSRDSHNRLMQDVGTSRFDSSEPRNNLDELCVLAPPDFEAGRGFLSLVDLPISVYFLDTGLFLGEKLFPSARNDTISALSLLEDLTSPAYSYNGKISQFAVLSWIFNDLGRVEKASELRKYCDAAMAVRKTDVALQALTIAHSRYVAWAGHNRELVLEMSLKHPGFLLRYINERKLDTYVSHFDQQSQESPFRQALGVAIDVVCRMIFDGPELAGFILAMQKPSAPIVTSSNELMI